MEGEVMEGTENEQEMEDRLSSLSLVETERNEKEREEREKEKERERKEKERKERDREERTRKEREREERDKKKSESISTPYSHYLKFSSYRMPIPQERDLQVG